MAPSLLSLVVPAYKQEKTIIKDITHLDKALQSLPCKYEIIVVVDGFVDNTYKKLGKIKSSRIKVLGYSENKGKSFAIKL